MKKLSINPIVLDALQQAFPKPANSANRALKKYLALLERCINESTLFERSAFNEKNGFYSVSKHDLANKGGQIGKHKIRVHKWLENNQLSLIEELERGSNLSGHLSLVKLSNLVTVTESTPDIYNLNHKINVDEIDENRSEFMANFSDMLEMDIVQITDGFDVLSVNVKSVAGYYEWLVGITNPTNKAKWNSAKYQTEKLLRIVKCTDGLLPQRKKPSEFGRNYYKGISVQSVNKQLRRAMLGNCWSYDLKSSVFSWKMAFADECHQASGANEEYTKFFSMTLYYLKGKKLFVNEVRADVFGRDSEYSRALQEQLLKQVFTAISFGAKATSKGWYTAENGWTTSAISSILKSQDVRERFFKNWQVTKFIAEQRALDDFIFQYCKSHDFDFLNKDCLRTPSGRISRSKVLSYIYQHYETDLMNTTANFLQSKGYEVLARVHDAIFLRTKILMFDREELQYLLEQESCSEFVRFAEEELLAYDPPIAHVLVEEAAHRQRMAEAEFEAQQTYLKLYGCK